jgi:hypothetical protein
MKRITGITLFLLMFSALSTFAQDVQPVNGQVAAIVASATSPAVKAAAILPLLNAAGATNSALKASYTKGMQKKDAIDLASAAYNKYLPPHNTAVANLNVELGQHNDWAARNQQAQNAHNANVCTAQEGSSACNWYNTEANNLNNEANRITAEAATLNSRGDFLNAEKGRLDEIQKNLSADTLEYTAWAKSYNADRDQNQANITLLLSTLRQILQSNDNCKQAIASGSDENMAEVCRQLFDGNRVPTNTNTNQGTGTRMYGEGANPTNEQNPHN